MKGMFQIVSVLALVVASHAQQMSRDNPASKEDILRLYKAMHIRERTQVMMDQSKTQSKVFLTDFLLKQVPGVSDKREQVDAMVDEMLNEIFKNYPTDEILEDSIPIYQKHLTTSDVDAIVRFYSTEVGQKVLKEMPAIISESSQLTQAHLQPRLQAAATKLTESLSKMVEGKGSQTSK